MLILLPILLAAASPVVPSCAKGIWDLPAGNQTMFRLEIGATPTGTTATWERPEDFRTDGESFTRVHGPTVRRSARSVTVADGVVELSFDDPAPRSTPDIFRLRCTDAGRLSAVFPGMGFEPFELVRSPGKAAPLGPWDADRKYVREIIRPTNAEMTAIFDADQADRRAERINWLIVSPADEKRRVRTEALLSAGALQSGEDYLHAAFVFQHGSLPNDFLKAHLLAMIATARGSSEAVWIASAALDRYLQAIGQPQVVGTQYKLTDGQPATQEPYDRALVSDAMRQALHVPPMAEQEKRRQQFTAKAPAPRKP